MIDKPKFLIPHQHIGVICSSIRISYQAIQPYNAGSQQGTHHSNHGIKHIGAGKVIERDIKAGTRFKLVLYFFILFNPTESLI